MLLFGENHTVSISLHPGVDEAVSLAARDLQRDLRTVSGRTDGFDVLYESYTSASVISIEITDGEPESYSVEITDAGVSIKGGDTLGAVYGIYAFSRLVLGFPPMHPLTGFRPPVKSSLAARAEKFCSRPHSVKLRGWLFNDEVAEECAAGAKEKNPFLSISAHPSVIDRVLECALRLEINLIIPPSVNMEDAAEERLVSAICRRGLSVSQPQHEPLGVSCSVAREFVAAHGKFGESASFVTNRARMEELWRSYAKKWARYGDKVVWQMGLRGAEGQSAWQTDTAMPEGSADRGAVISEAIAAQRDIIGRVLGKRDFRSMVTLRPEEAELYRAGRLSIPVSTVLLFGDIGLSQMHGDDFYNAEHGSERACGVYYQKEYKGTGPRLCEGCDPHKMAFFYSEAAKRGSLDCAILNASDLRAQHLCAELSSMLSDDPTRLPVRTALRRIFKPVFDKEADIVLDLYLEYFSAFADLGSMELIRLCNKHGLSYHGYGRLLFPEFSATDGELCEIARALMLDLSHLSDYATAVAKIAQGEKKFAELVDKMGAVEHHLSPEALSYFKKFIRLPATYMMHLSRFTVAVYEMMNAFNSASAEAARNKCISAVGAILDERKILADKDTPQLDDERLDLRNLQALVEQAHKTISSRKR